MSKVLTAKCITSRKLQKKPLDQLMGQIPSLRVAAGFPPFSNTTIDMFGPFLSEDFCCDLKWLWNIPHASHQNGVVETLIKSVRQGVNVTCNSQAFTEEQWRTFLSETTYLINGHPLYTSSNNIWEGPPITPNDILMAHHLSHPQPESEESINPRHLLRSTQDRVDEFWKCWMRYFTPDLLPRNKWFRTRENVEVDDLVLELDLNQK